MKKKIQYTHLFYAAGLLIFIFLSFTGSCIVNINENEFDPSYGGEIPESADFTVNIELENFTENPFSAAIKDVLSNMQLPLYISEKIHENLSNNADFIYDLTEIFINDRYLWILIDKNNFLAEDTDPDDLVDIVSGSSGIIANLMLRKEAYDSLAEMTAAAEEEGLELTVISAYRSYLYQGRVYTYWVVTLGQEEADRISARPGSSQHQLGFTVDFNMLDNALSQTPEGIWLFANASRFGWSLSYPDGYEDVTGYDWESWHYRYVGKFLSEFIEKYFDGIQQYAFEFIHNYQAVLQN